MFVWLWLVYALNVSRVNTWSKKLAIVCAYNLKIINVHLQCVEHDAGGGGVCVLKTAAAQIVPNGRCPEWVMVPSDPVPNVAKNVVPGAPSRVTLHRRNW